MADPATIAALVGLVKDVLDLTGGSWDRFKKSRPEYRVFWEQFEKQLKPESRDVPWQRLHPPLGCGGN
jgi:hypothetical protein